MSLPRGAAGDADVDPWLWQSIVATLLCCLPLGAFAVFKASSANKALARGDVQAARSDAKTAKTLTIVSFVSGIVLMVAAALMSGLVASLSFSADVGTADAPPAVEERSPYGQSSSGSSDGSGEMVQLPPDLLEPASFAGTGDAVIELPYVTSVGVALTFENAGGFVSVRSLSSDGEIVEYLISAIDPYSGTVCICDFYYGAVAAIQIESESSWALEVSDLRDRPVFSGSASGVGDEVLLVGVPAGPLTASYEGDGNFIIWSWAVEGRDLLVNEIGDFSGTVQLPDAVFITIAASEGGAWSLESGGASDLG